MDTHELTGRMIECEKQLSAQKEEIKTLFFQQKDVKVLAESTNKLAVSVERLTTQMMSHEERLEEMEDGIRYKGRTVWACIVTGILGAAIAYVMTALLS